MRLRPPARALLVATAVAILGVFPLIFSSPTSTSIAVFTLIFMVAACAWNMFAGSSGYIALGHAVYFGCGAYTLTLLANHLGFAAGWGVFALVPVAGIVAGLIAVPTGLIALRARRHTFVVITIAFMFIFQLAAFNLGFTGGSSGLQPPTPLWSVDTYNLNFYYVTAVVLLATFVLTWLVRRSRFGLQLLSIRDDEERARGLGVRVARVKLSAFVLSAIPVGMVGGIYAYFLGQIFPQFAFDPLFDLSIALMAFIGGLGTLVGPLLGALVLESLQQYFTVQYGSSQAYLIIYGALFLVVVLLLPRGVIPSLEELISRARAEPPEQGPEEPGRTADTIEAVR
ncbi:MAG: branched-chain amino acid ABC transporter permease [Solirubrobacterales bacterium]|nr:branched-chain amino acid ABC transporter permease [Solirubrobacterales bacterium]MBV9808014.1 branched-chain amino acid ABC transporter permease [Solirubrobacterales bacterium]